MSTAPRAPFARHLVPLLIAFTFGIATAAYIYLERRLYLTESPVLALEHKVLDFKFLARGRVEVDPAVVIAAGDAKTLASFGRWGTWDRAKFKLILDNLFAAKASVVAFDMVFADPVGIDHENADALVSIVQDGQLDEAAQALDACTAQGAPPDPACASAEKIHAIAGATATLAARLKTATGGNAQLAEAFDTYASQVVQGFIAMPNPDSGIRPKVHSPEDIAALEPFGIADYGEGWRVTDLDDNAKAKGAEATVAQLAKKEGGKPSDLRRTKAVNGDLVLPLKEFIDVASNLGFFSADPDPDGVMRRLPLVYRLGELFLPSLSLSAAALYFGATPALIADPTFEDGLIRVGFPAEGGKIVEVPVDPSGALRVNYFGPAGAPNPEVPEAERGAFPRVSLADVADGKFDAALVKGKIVLVAVTAIGTFDQRVTPFSPIAPGVEIHAAAIQNMINGSALDRPELHLQLEMLLALAFALFAGVTFSRISVTASVALAAAMVVAWVSLDFVVLFRKNLWFYDVPFVIQIAFTWAGMTVWGYLTEGREKAQLKREFSTVLAPTVVEQLLKDPKLAGLGGMERELTVMFSDIRGFTSMSEKLSPEGLTQFLNEYLTPMTEILIQREGTLDKYMGDAIMAFWGAPIEQKDHAARACLAGLDMLTRLDELKAKWRSEGKPDIDIGIGLNSGLMRVGFMGSARMRNYTLLGDNVNLGSRLEGTNKNYGTHIIVSEHTYTQAKHVVYGRWLDGVRVKGKREPVQIYELLGARAQPGASPPPDAAAFITRFEEGLQHFRAKRWDDAEAAFHEVARLRGGSDPPSAVYLERVAHFREEPPPADWDGVYEFKTK